MTVNLVLSLIFGVGQIVVGGALVGYGVTGGRWRRWRVALAAFIGAWFVASGGAELLVSGMEVAQRLTGAPTPAVFAAWRGHADAALFAVTAALALGGLAYLVAALAGWPGRAPQGGDR